jgi:hypothetical protein
VLTKGITKWGIRDAREIEQWNPRLRFLERSFVGALYKRIPSAPVRLLWRLVYATPARNYDVLNRFAFGVVRHIGASLPASVFRQVPWWLHR